MAKKRTVYIQELGDLEQSIEEAIDFAMKIVNKKFPPRKDGRPTEFRNPTYQAILWELMHDILIVSRRVRESREVKARFEKG
jgi:hypothetical protein